MNEDILKNIKIMPDQKLCEIIISSRYLKIMNEEAILCMKELSERRASGNIFDFETFIDTELKKLPIFDLDLNKILKGFKAR